MAVDLIILCVQCVEILVHFAGHLSTICAKTHFVRQGKPWKSNHLKKFEEK